MDQSLFAKVINSPVYATVTIYKHVPERVTLFEAAKELGLHLENFPDKPEKTYVYLTRLFDFNEKPIFQQSFEEFGTLKDLSDFLYLHAKIPVKPAATKKLFSGMLTSIKASRDKKEFITELCKYSEEHNLLYRTYDRFIVNYDMFVENKTKSLSPSVHS
ncbi:hypothetical protein [Bacillus pseudomycoides]|uniref:hypothetical protein n=1 Tax=Bacillus pseudomycoides TaxID=64104 RepID=UPI001F0B62AD|nr:hypothetical protein [Bacillus pseudomycoides]